VKHALVFTKTDSKNLVECGVADGVTAMFALRELKSMDSVTGKFYFV